MRASVKCLLHRCDPFGARLRRRFERKTILEGFADRVVEQQAHVIERSHEIAHARGVGVPVVLAVGELVLQHFNLRLGAIKLALQFRN